jgi:ubiquinone/menaquinone biosynthesis C-methylase UbiE/CheY-like chemotaxis protein
MIGPAVFNKIPMVGNAMAVSEIDRVKEKTVRPVILIVDDDLPGLEKLRQTLEESYVVQTAVSGVEAIHEITTRPEIDVLIVNDELPRMKGIELFRFLQETVSHAKRIVKILITDNSVSNKNQEAAKYGRIDYICSKPLDPEELFRTVNFLMSQRSLEKRTSMRVTLTSSEDIQIEAGNAQEAKLVNISENGMFLRTSSFFPEGSALPFKITLPDGRQYNLQGRIIRQDLKQGGIGVEFQAVDDRSRHSILQFLSEYVTLRDLGELKVRYPFLNTNHMVLFTDKDKIESLMCQALQPDFEIVAIHVRTKQPEILRLSDLNAPLFCTLSGKDLHVKFKTSDLIFVSFQIGYATYNFESMVSRIASDGKNLICIYPKVMFYSEKRAVQRIQPCDDLNLEISLPSPFKGEVRGEITDISREGVGFVTNSQNPTLLIGTPLDTLKIWKDETLLWEETGEVRNVIRIDQNGRSSLRYGIQFGIGRMSIQSIQAPSVKFPLDERRYSASTTNPKDRNSRPRSNQPTDYTPQVIRLENDKGEELVGLLNTSMPLQGEPTPVVLIPPAFGKTKETLFGLALTIIQNFQDLDKPVAVIRYDGIRRKGESFKDPEASEPPFEMVNASLSQGAKDIKAVLDWLEHNSQIKATSVTLVTLSLSALEARIALRDEVCRKKINYWISCVGTLEFRNLMNRVNCGLDLLEQYQIGIDLGVIPILGNLIDMVPFASDVVANEVASLDQARKDMRHLDLPITWIYGEHDSWVLPEFVRDIMSIKVNAQREAISLPIGHTARTSKEAISMFCLIFSLIHRTLYQEMLPARIPTKADMEFMRRAEKDRLPPRKLKNRKKYWQRYLVGEDNCLGFDVMALSDDYFQLMEDQIRALQLKPQDRLLDLGGGTGNMIEHLMKSEGPLPQHITIADLIPEAMIQASSKLVSRFDVLQEPGRFSLLCVDAELNRFLPVRSFLNGEIGNFVELADRIESLDLKSAHKIHKAYSPRLHRILRGDPVTPELEYWMKSRFELPEYKIILDFNEAAKYVRGLLTSKPEFRKLVFSGDLNTNPHLPFQSGCYNKIIMSLVLSYIFNPLETLKDLRRIISPGGLLVLSSMQPDTDASGLFMRILTKIEAMPEEALPPQWPKPRLLDSLRSFLNDAQALVDLEEAGTFDFFDPEKLSDMLEESGWDQIRSIPTFGSPPQGYIVIASPRENYV